MKINPDHPGTYLRGLEPVSFCDWPGKITSVLFFGTCNLRCPTCHNRDLVLRPEELPLIPWQRLLDTLSKRKHWLDGLVVSGGEPTCVPGVDSLLSELSGLGLPLKLDSNGLNPEHLADLLERDIVQYVAVDIKGPPAKYPELTGGRCSREQAEKSLNHIFDLTARHPNRFKFRCTKVPALTDEDMERVQSMPPEGYRIAWQTYIPPSRRSGEASGAAGVGVTGAAKQAVARSSR